MAADFDLQQQLLDLPGDLPTRVTTAVDLLLAAAERHRVSDAHFEPSPAALNVRFRVDGVLQHAASLPAAMNANVVARLKVLAELLTYRLDVPQEGSVRREGTKPTLRVSTFPTIDGEKVVVRFFAANEELTTLDQLGFTHEHQSILERILREQTGAILLTGPSGSGKTTTAYACLQEIVASAPGRNIVSIEDPVERRLSGVSQSQVKPGSEFDFARGLRSILRQDPEVLLVGEIRDRQTAAIASEASLTGHLVLSTLHAGSCCGAISRLLDMGVEPYLLTSGLRAIVNQRLIRQLCKACAAANPQCRDCVGTGYRGRLLIAELLEPDAALKNAILSRADDSALEAAAGKRLTLRAAAMAAVAAGRTTDAEIGRVLGATR